MKTISAAKEKIIPYLTPVNEIALANQEKVLKAFHAARVGSHCFTDSTGYAYSDQGRETLEEVYANVFRAEAALVRPQIVSGTHAISICLSILEPGEELLSASGAPYDTLQAVIGVRGDSPRSLTKRGIIYKEVPLRDDLSLDLTGITAAVSANTKMVMLQRSRGYSWRPALRISDLAEAVRAIRAKNSECIIFVDNCYGEFVEYFEPLEVGVDLIAGSLIKNPGGTLATSGGYIAGREDLVNLCGEILTAPSLGSKLGAMFGVTREILHGLFLAPHVVGEAVSAAILAAQVFSDLGYAVSPEAQDTRSDIVQAIRFNSKEELLRFCHGIQKAAPIDAHYMPVPSLMPGYVHEVVMAGGTFILGSSIELSADAPLREPYIGYLQGGMSRQHAEIGLKYALQEMGLGVD